MDELLNQDTQTNQPVINQPNQNIFKYLFLFILVLFFIILGLLAFVLIKQKNNSSLIQTNQTTPTPVITTETEPIETSAEPTTSISNIRVYSKTVGSKINLILNINNQETIIDSVSTDDKITFDKLSFSQSTRYLTYVFQGQTMSVTKVYDTQKKSFIKNPKNPGYNGFQMLSGYDPIIITNDEKFLVHCTGSGYGGSDGAIILSLPEGNIKFDFEKYLGAKLVSPSVSCIYHTSDNTVSLFYYKDMEETKEDTVTYNLSTGSIE